MIQTDFDSKLTAPECDFLIDLLTYPTGNVDGDNNYLQRSSQKYKINVRTIKKKLGVQADIADGEIEYVVR
tara:strand:- start:269 stop:481 length:213 start_codon:yes stop_codon:yes gene_type:complete